MLTQDQQNLVTQNQKLVYSCVKRFVNQNPQYKYLSHDLVQSGFIGLMKGVMAFKESYDTELSTIAYRQIYWALNEEVYKNRKSFDCESLTIKNDEGEEFERPIPAKGLDPELNAICKEYVEHQSKPIRPDKLKRLCSVHDCGKLYRSNGLCKLHLDRWKRLGTTELKCNITVCSIDGCNKPFRARGRCVKHYKQLMKTGVH